MALEKIRPRVVDATGNYTFNDVNLTGNISAPTSNIGNLTGVNNLVANSTTITVTGTLSTTANVIAGNIKTDNLLYANGVAWSLGSTASGTNTQVQFNDAGSFGASSAFAFDKTTNILTVTKISGNGSLLTTLTGANVTGTVGNATYATSAGTATSATTAGTVTTAAQPNITSVGTLTSLDVTGNITSGNANLGNLTTSNFYSGNGSLLSSITGANVSGAVSYATTANSVAGSNVSGAVTYAATANAVAGANVMGQVGNALVAGTVYTAAQPNITSVGTLSSLSVTGDISGANLTLSGNLIVSGTTTTVNSTTTRVVDPIVEQGGGANGAALSSNDSKDRGTLLHYYTGSTATDAFVGWDNSNAEFAFGSNVSVTSEVVTFNNFGNVRASYFLGNGSQLTGVSATSATTAYKLANGTSNVDIATSGGNVTVGVSGNAAIITVTGTGVNISGTLNTGTGNITSGNANLGNLTTSNYFTGNGSLLTSLTGANVTGAVPYATTANAVAGANVSGAVSYATTANSVAGANVSGQVTYAATANAVAGANVSGAVAYATTANAVAGANVSGQVSNALVAGTVYTAAQPNITSVGTLSSLSVTGNITSGNANLGNLTTSNYFSGSGQYLTSVTAVTAATVTTNAQPNITSVGTLTSLVVGNATANTTFGNGTITALGNISFTGANVSLGSVSNLHITGGTAGYFITTDGAGNLSWGAASGGGGTSASGSNTQIQFNDGGVLGAVANLAFDKTSNTLTVDRAIHINGANLGSNVSNVYIGGGSSNQILKTDGSGNLTWIAQPVATITVDNFTGDGTTVAFTLSTTPTSKNFTVVNYNGAFQLREAYTVSGTTITFSDAPASGSKVEVTTTSGATSGAGAFTTRTYTGNGVATTFTVTSGVTVSSVIVTENGLVQTPTTDYTISGTTLTFAAAPANGVVIQIRELAIAIVTAPAATSLTAAVANVIITGGSSGQALVTDGAGNISFGTAGVPTGKVVALNMFLGF